MRYIPRKLLAQSITRRTLREIVVDAGERRVTRRRSVTGLRRSRLPLAVQCGLPITGAVPANYGMRTPCDVPTGPLMPTSSSQMMMMMMRIAAGIGQNNLRSQSVIANLSVSPITEKSIKYCTYTDQFALVFSIPRHHGDASCPVTFSVCVCVLLKSETRTLALTEKPRDTPYVI